MSLDPNSPARTTSVHLPLALLALAVALFMFAQVRATSTQNDILNWQIENSDKQAKDLSDALAAANNRITSSAPVDQQIDQIRARAESILSDVIELAKDDADAKLIVDKYGIQRAQPPQAPAQAPAGAPTATPAPR